MPTGNAPAESLSACLAFIFLNRFFFPDHSATSQMLSSLAFHLAGSGHDVHVITSQQRYDDPAARLPAHETAHNVTIHRVASTHFGRASLPGRGVDYLSFYVTLWRAALGLAKRGDIIIAKTDPPLASVPASWAAARSGARLVNWLQDLYPEVAVELKVPYISGRAAAGSLAWLRDKSLRAAAANVAIGERMREKVIARGIPQNRVHVIPNWCDDQTIVPVPHAYNPLRREWALEDKFVVGYSGNLGRAHEFDTVLAAAERLRDNPRIVFLFIGGGHAFSELGRRVKEHDLDRSFRFLPYQDDVHLKHSLNVPDVHWMSLKPELEGLIVPSKFYGIAAAGRPVIAILGQNSEFEPVIREHGCGLTIAPGDSTGLAAAILRLASDNEWCMTLGRQARAMIDGRFNRQRAFTQWDQLLRGVASGVS